MRLLRPFRAQEKAGPLMKELESLLVAAESCVADLEATVDAATLEKSEEAVKAGLIRPRVPKLRPVRST